MVELHKIWQITHVSTVNTAITYARDGFPVSELIAYYLHHSAEGWANMKALKRRLCQMGRHLKKVKYLKISLAATYEKIASGGRDAFYQGDIARIIASYMKRQGGFLHMRISPVIIRMGEPVSTNYRGYDVGSYHPMGKVLPPCKFST